MIRSALDLKLTNTDSLAGTDRDISTLVCTDPEEGPETIATIKRWLDRCVLGGPIFGAEEKPHDLCRWSMTRTIIDECSVPIPADRIIDVGEISDDYIRLVGTVGLKARYCAFLIAGVRLIKGHLHGLVQRKRTKLHTWKE
jgi:hypothetical protein